ncbi:hypothetical protein Btru_019863 [Bulinus truncatus]|nr:hypothetical protein Btru_019863 [Bulinus truncatus]
MFLYSTGNLEESQVRELVMDRKYNDHMSPGYYKSHMKQEYDKTHYYSYETGSSSDCPSDLSVSNRCEYVSKDEHLDSSHLDIPPPTVQVDVVGSDDEFPSADSDDLKVDRRGDEDSGVVLDLSRSREVHSSPRPEHCWAKPLLASTPLWRPWSHPVETPVNFVHNTYQEHFSTNCLETTPFGQHDQPNTYPTTSTDLPLDLRITPQYQGCALAINHPSAPPPLQSPPSYPALHLNYPLEPPTPEVNGTSSPTRYQSLKATTTCIATREVKRPSSDTQVAAPVKRVRVPSTPEKITRAPFTEISSFTFQEQTHNIPGVLLGVPPADALPARVSLKGKRKASKEDQNGTKNSKISDSAKKRDRPPPYGDHELHEFNVKFDDTSLKAKYCSEDGKYQVPKVPDSREDQAQLRTELLELFRHSNLPSVPSALQYNVHALCFYPKMQHLFSLHLDGVNLEVLNFGAYGQAFANLRLAALSDDDLNTILDRMSYVGADGLMHCLVRRAIDNGAVCGHVATELGKMRRHSKNHFPEKKWVCCFCRAQMPDMTDMERHTSTHTGLKPFRCIECNKFFSQKVTLAHHLKSVHNLELEKMDPKKEKKKAYNPVDDLVKHRFSTDVPGYAGVTRSDLVFIEKKNPIADKKNCFKRTRAAKRVSVIFFLLQ